MVIGPMLETSLRQSMNITGGNLSGMILRPICLAMYILVSLTFLLPLVRKCIRRSPNKFQSPDKQTGNSVP